MSQAERLENLKRDATAPSEVFRLLTDGDDPKTLPEIAKEFGVQRGKFIEWFSTEHKDRLDAAERVLGIEVCHAVKRMTDEATVENFSLVKFKTDRYLRLAGLLNAERYSPKVEHKHSGLMPVLVIEIAGQEPAKRLERVVNELPGEAGDAAVDVPPSTVAPARLPAGIAAEYLI